MQVQKFEEVSQKTVGTKTYKIWRDYGWLQTSTVNIPGMDEDIHNQTSMWSTAISPAFNEK